MTRTFRPTDADSGDRFCFTLALEWIARRLLDAVKRVDVERQCAGKAAHCLAVTAQEELKRKGVSTPDFVWGKNRTSRRLYWLLKRWPLGFVRDLSDIAAEIHALKRLAFETDGVNPCAGTGIRLNLRHLPDGEHLNAAESLRRLATVVTNIRPDLLGMDPVYLASQALYSGDPAEQPELREAIGAQYAMLDMIECLDTPLRIAIRDLAWTEFSAAGWLRRLAKALDETWRQNLKRHPSAGMQHAMAGLAPILKKLAALDTALRELELESRQLALRSPRDHAQRRRGRPMRESILSATFQLTNTGGPIELTPDRIVASPARNRSAAIKIARADLARYSTAKQQKALRTLYMGHPGA